jgi:hypothetical protein
VVFARTTGGGGAPRRWRYGKPWPRGRSPPEAGAVYVAWPDKTTRCVSIAIGNPSAVIRIVLPRSWTQGPGVWHVGWDEEAVPWPAPIAPPPKWANHREANSKHNHGTADVNAGRWREVERRVVGPRPGSIDNGRVVIGHIDRVRADWLDGNFVCFAPDGLLGRGLQCASSRRSPAQTLNGVHDIRLLREKGVADLLAPLQIRVHHAQNVGEWYQRLYAQIPTLLFQGGSQRVSFEPSVVWAFQPTRGFDYLEWVSCGCQNLRNKWVRVERDGRR